MKFNRVNNIVGWLVGLIACSVYVLTMEPTGSFWDCGEFISSCYKLQIPHPPGAPLFTLIGRFFIILFGDDPMTAARGVNFMSAIASGITILFLFWTITHFARKLVQKNKEELTGQQLFNIMAAGVIGALAYCFSDSFWFSAVEGEVYAMSSLFTAIVFWAILKWEHEVDTENSRDGHKFSRADRWLVFIFYMMGLSIGVHLLGILTIPAIVMVYYFKRYNVSKWGVVRAFIVGCVITGLVQVAIVQWSIKGAGAFDILFVNSFGMPFFVGFAAYFVLLFGLLIIGLRFSEEQIRKFKNFPVWLSLLVILFCFPFIKSGLTFFLFLVGLTALLTACYYQRAKIAAFLRIGLWSVIFLIIGYSTYMTTLIRSSANPSVDMYNVDNPVSLVGYLSREQYGDWPILYGNDFIYRPSSVQAGDLYVKGEVDGHDRYVVGGKITKQDFSAPPSQDEMDRIAKQHPDWDLNKIGPHIFPRMYDNGTERNQEYMYRVFGGLDQGEQPSFFSNIRFFANYQFRWMYWRYFMWNFAGKQNDLQGFGNPRDGNWASGINFIDKLFGTSTPDVLPETAGKLNKANNKLYFLPFILGLLGLFYQYQKTRRDWLVTFILFFFTGFAIVIYLNQAGQQPRERDYAYVGSFYAFAIWIGLGVLWVKELLGKYIKGAASSYAAFTLCLLAVPVLMASQEWDDHDRSQKTLAYDMGKNYLESCAKDAIVISFGDNDTYPLWYSQEVAGVRPDLRVMNYSLLGTDWYINQLRYKVNESAPADVIFTPEQIQGDNRNIVILYNMPGYDPNKYYDLYTVLKNVTASDDQKNMVPIGDDEMANVIPCKKLSIPVDVEAVKKSMPFNAGDSIVSELHLDINRNYIQKNDLAVLAIIAANNWKRPIYFTSSQELDNLGLDKYVRMEGLGYRLVPVMSKAGLGSVETNLSYKNVMEKFAYGGANKKGTYFDEENRRHINSLRSAHAFLALSLSDEGKNDSARKILNRYDNMVLQSNVPYGMTSNRGNFHDRISMTFLLACYQSGDMKLADKVSSSIRRDLDQQMKYYRSLGDGTQSNEQLAAQAYALLNNRGGALSRRQESFANDILSSFQMSMQLDDWEKQYNPKAAGNPAESAPGNLATPDSGRKAGDSNGK